MSTLFGFEKINGFIIIIIIIIIMLITFLNKQ